MVFGFEAGDEVLLKFGLDTTGITRGVEEAKRELGEIGKSVDELGNKNIKWSDIFKISSVVTGASVAVMMFGDKMNALNATMSVSAQQLSITTGRVKDLMLQYSDAGMSAEEFAGTFDLLVRGGMKNDEQIAKTVMVFDDLGHVTRTEAEAVTSALIPAFKAFKIPLEDAGKYTNELSYLFRTSLVDMTDFGTMSMKIGSKLEQLGVSMEDEIAILKILNDTQGKSGLPATMLLRSAITDLTQAEDDAKAATINYNESLQQMADLTATTAQITTDYQDTLDTLAEEKERIDDQTRDYVYRVGDEERAIRKLTDAYNESMRSAKDVAGEKSKIEQTYGERIGDQETKIARLKEDYAYAMRSAFGNTNKQAELTEEYNRALADEEERLARLKREKEESLTAVDTESAETQARLTEEYTERLAEQEEQLRRTKEAQEEALSEANAKLAESQTKAAEDYNQRLVDNQKEIDALKKKQEEYQATIEKGKTSKEDFFKLLGMTPEQVALQVATQQKESEGLAARIAALEEGKISAAEKAKFASEKFGIESGIGGVAGWLAAPASIVGGIGGGIAGLSGLLTLGNLLGGGGAATSGTIAAGQTTLGMFGGTGVAGTATAAGGAALAAGALGGAALGGAAVWGMEQLGVLGLEHAYTNFMTGGKGATGKAGIIEGAGAWTGGALSRLNASVGRAISDLPGQLEGVSDTVKEVFETLIGDVTDIITEGWDDLLEGVMKFGKDFVKNLTLGVTGRINDLTGAIGKISSEFSAGFTKIISAAITWGASLVGNLVTGIENTFSTLTTEAGKIASTLTNAVTGAVTNALQGGKDFIVNIVSGISGTISSLTTEAGKVLTEIRKAFPSATAVTGWGKGIIDNAVKGIGEVFSSLTKKAGEIFTAIARGFPSVAAVTGWGKRTIDSFVAGVTGVWSTLTDKSDKILSAITKGFPSATAVIGWGKDLISNFITGVTTTDIWSKFTTWMGTILNKITAAFPSATTATGWGSDLIDSFIDGVAGTDVWSKFTSWMGDILDEITGAFPSYDTALKWGQDVINGFSSGIGALWQQFLDWLGGGNSAATYSPIMGMTGAVGNYGVIPTPAARYSVSYQISNHFDFSNLTIRDDRDIDMITTQVATKINRAWRAER